MTFNLLISLYRKRDSLFSHRARTINGTVDGICPRPFNEVHEIHKPSRELGRLGYAETILRTY